MRTKTISRLRLAWVHSRQIVEMANLDVHAGTVRGGFGPAPAALIIGESVAGREGTVRVVHSRDGHVELQPHPDDGAARFVADDSADLMAALELQIHLRRDFWLAVLAIPPVFHGDELRLAGGEPKALDFLVRGPLEHRDAVHVGCGPIAASSRL